ncbi:hypothetical protein [Porphyromonas sp. HMSC065F10]|uniref:hypothetical protein n=1 Tax=Porphyromonas sp. HMSC065F10 TaxID=1739394 RepID=UPI0008A19B4F|nr:hypothetical protein [Porphyromonas sp. HMSC065F10]OFR40205.1 hypothetical protein HMPREF2890_01205 [Porphyromonas sp. HMSC065F10]
MSRRKAIRLSSHPTPFVIILTSTVLLMLANRYLMDQSAIVDLIATILPIVIIGPVYFFLGKKQGWALSLGSVLLAVLLMAALVGIASYVITVR